MIKCVFLKVSNRDNKEEVPLVQQLMEKIQEWQTKEAVEDGCVVSIIRKTEYGYGLFAGEYTECAEVWYGDEY